MTEVLTFEDNAKLIEGHHDDVITVGGSDEDDTPNDDGAPILVVAPGKQIKKPKVNSNPAEVASAQAKLHDGHKPKRALNAAPGSPAKEGVKNHHNMKKSHHHDKDKHHIIKDGKDGDHHKDGKKSKHKEVSPGVFVVHNTENLEEKKMADKLNKCKSVGECKEVMEFLIVECYDIEKQLNSHISNLKRREYETVMINKQGALLIGLEFVQKNFTLKQDLKEFWKNHMVPTLGVSLNTAIDHLCKIKLTIADKDKKHRAKLLELMKEQLARSK